MTRNSLIPTEFEEQCVFVQYLTFKGIKFTAIPNSTFTKSHNQKRLNTASGLRRGFPDLVVLILPSQSKDGVGRTLAIEMKRVKGGKVTPEQEQWIEDLRQCGVEATVCKGAEEAITYMEQYAK